MKLLTSTLFALAIICAVESYEYDVTVKLGDYEFENVEGSLKMKIHGPNSIDTFRIVQTKLERGRTYGNRMEINYKLNEINHLSAYWTLTNPYDVRYLFSKPVIYLSEIKILSDEEFFSKRLHKTFKPANPAQKLAHKQEVTLNLFESN